MDILDYKKQADEIKPLIDSLEKPKVTEEYLDRTLTGKLVDPVDRIKSLNSFVSNYLGEASKISTDGSNSEKNKAIMLNLFNMIESFTKETLPDGDEGMKTFGQLQSLILEGKKQVEKMDELPVV